MTETLQFKELSPATWNDFVSPMKTDPQCGYHLGVQLFRLTETLAKQAITESDKSAH